MRKIIDLCLDMPPDADFYANTLAIFCFDPNYAGYKAGFGSRLAEQIGFTIDGLDALAAEEGESAFREKVRAAAEKVTPTLEDFVAYLDGIGVEWGITVSHSRNNRETGEIVRRFPNKFKGFIFVDPNQGMEAVRELETSVKEYGLHALYLTAFRTKLTADDRRNYPLYTKCCELNIPVHIYSSFNLSKAVPHDIGHPRYIDRVARDFPELRIMAGVSGWPWVQEFIGVCIRHENVYVNFETYTPSLIDKRGSGMEFYLHYGENRIQNKLCFATNWTTQGVEVGDLVAQLEALPFSDATKDKIFYENAARFYAV